jgi:hypothetical protein
VVKGADLAAFYEVHRCPGPWNIEGSLETPPLPRSLRRDFQVNPSRRYVLISPCRDEAQCLRRTLASGRHRPDQRRASPFCTPATWFRLVLDEGHRTEQATRSWQQPGNTAGRRDVVDAST